MTCEEAQRLAGAYLDGELERTPGEVHPESFFEAHLEGCAGCRAHVESLRSLSEDLRAAPYYRAPAALVSALAPKRPTTTRRMPEWLPWAIAMAACLVAAVSIVRPLANRSAGAGEADAIVASHLRSLMADHLVDVASSDRHTVKPWFVGKLNFSPTVVDLVSEGFPLVGGRLDYVDGHEAAALVYRRREHTINVWIWPSAVPTEETTTRDDPRGYHLVHWARDGMSYWAASDVAREDLADFTRRLIDATAKGS